MSEAGLSVRDLIVRFPAEGLARWCGHEGPFRVGLTSSIDAGPMAVIGARPGVRVARVNRRAWNPDFQRFSANGVPRSGIGPPLTTYTPTEIRAAIHPLIW